MKKIISSILIAIVILQIFAPFTVGFENKKVEIKSNKSEAADECIVTNVSFTPQGESTDQTTILLPVSIIAKINTKNCIGKTIEINIDESFNYTDQSVFTKKIKVENNETQLKLNPTEFRCGSKNLCGFKYEVGYGAYNSQYGWSINFKSNKSTDYFYKCTTNGCTNQSSWSGEVITGGSNLIEIPEINYNIKMTGKVTNTDKKATVTLTVLDKTDYLSTIAGSTTYKYTLNLYLKNSNGTIIQEKKLSYNDWSRTIDPIEFAIEHSTKYTIDGSIDVFETTLLNGQSSGKTYNEISKFTPPLSFTSNESGNQTVIETGNISATAENELDQNEGLPACGIMPASKGTIMGCVAQGLYYLFFRTTSFIFGFAGRILDFSLFYSISDSSYRSTFVVEGWGIIRDFCNMFFIFILLYVAIGTILNLHSVKTKEMIINVVIIGLLMNFSLFATQVIIDASNILTRVFYNTQTIITGKDSGGIIKSELGKFGEIQLSGAIVAKVDPQRLITRANEINSIPQKGVGVETKTSLGIGSFILVVFLATAVNIVGIIAFISCAIIFITRVIGLWLAMILVPIAFFSYTVPTLSNIKMVGWTHWWPDTLKLAFLAPVFAFFMYIIVGFMDKGLGIVDILFTKDLSGMNLFIAIVVPFIFIMVLLMKAKSIANDMSGEIGQSITNGIKTVGGIALGAAAGGVALAGRSIIGKGMAKMSRGDTLSQKFADPTKKQQLFNDFNNTKNPFKKISSGLKIVGGKVGSTVGLNKLQTGAGGLLNKAQKDVGGIDHARHVMDETKKAAGLENVDDKNLSGEDITKLKTTFARTKQSESDTQVRAGYDAKGKEIKLKDDTGAIIKNAKGEEIIGAEDFKKKMRDETEAQYRIDKGYTAAKKLSAQDTNAIENELNKQLNAVVKATVKIKVEDDFHHEKSESEKHVNPLVRGFAGANKNSYDLRKLSEMKTDNRESFLTKGTVGLVAAIAGGVRSGIKGVGMSNGGVKVEGNFLKDLGSTISDALKSMKVNVDLSHAGEHKSSADAHGGGGHH